MGGRKRKGEKGERKRLWGPREERDSFWAVFFFLSGGNPENEFCCPPKATSICKFLNLYEIEVFLVTFDRRPFLRPKKSATILRKLRRIPPPFHNETEAGKRKIKKRRRRGVKEEKRTLRTKTAVGRRSVGIFQTLSDTNGGEGGKEGEDWLFDLRGNPESSFIKP